MVQSISTIVPLVLLGVGLILVCVCSITTINDRVPNSFDLKPPKPISRVTNAFVWLSIGMYVAACALPAVQFDRGTKIMYGWFCLTSPILGWQMIFLAWYWNANPTYFVALWLYKRKSTGLAFCLGLVSAMLASSFHVIMLKDFWCPTEHDVPFIPWNPLLIGAWLWWGSIWLFTVSAWLQHRSADGNRSSREAARETAPSNDSVLSEI